MANFGTALPIIKLGREQKIDYMRSLSLFFTVGKKEGGPSFNKLYIVIYIFRACLPRKELIKPGRWVVLANQLTPTITYNGKEMN